MSNSVLVTGAAGFLGAHLTRELQKEGCYDIVALDDLSGGYRENIPSGVEFIQMSVTDSKGLSDLFHKKKFRYVYHLAAYAAEGLSHFIRKFNYTNNLVGSINIINECIKHDVKCLVFTSSVAVYGTGQVPMHESMKPEPEDPYGIAKYTVELDIHAAHEMFGLNYVIFRPHNIYGEYQNIGDKYRNVVGIFMNQILNEEEITIFGDGEQQRAFSYVGDIVPSIMSSAWTSEAQGATFNIGADTPVTVNELAKEVTKIMGVPNHPIKHLPARNEVKLAYCDHTIANSVFSSKNTPLNEGLAKMAAWVNKVGGRSTPFFKNIEIDKNLPSSWIKLSENK